MSGNIKSDMSYQSSKGGITWKSDVGTLLYNYPGKPYAVSGIDTSGAGLVFPEYAQEISYTSFESVGTISENDYLATFIYNSDNQRAKMAVQQNGNTILTRWYPSGSYIKETAGGVTKEYTFIGGDAYSAPVVAVKTNGGEPVYYYLLRDYLGSITHVVDATGNNVVAEYSYDAWGRMRNPSTWENYSPGSEPAPFIAGRGYTGHEHLPWFSFVNMLSEGPDDVLKSGGAKSRNPGLPGAAGNGRVYDPLTGQFLSPDNYVQAPDFTQNFNRYAYCLNNPLIYTDPDGEFIFTLLAAITGQWWALPITIGADIGAITGGIRGAKDHDVGFWKGAGRGALVGAVGGALSMVGGGTFVANVAWGMVEGTITGGLDAALWGNDVGKGMLYGAAIGGAFAAATSGIEAYGNYKDGYGFRTNEGVVNNYIKNNQYQNAIDYVQTKYGMSLNYQGQNVSMKYNASLTDYGVTDPITGNIEIGPAAFGSSSELKATIVHEFGHSVKDRILDASGNFVNWQYPPSSFASTSLTLVNDGPLGYANEIFNAGKLHIKLKFLAPNYNPLFSEWNRGFKWYYLAPRRYNSQIKLRWY